VLCSAIAGAALFLVSGGGAAAADVDAAGSPLAAGMFFNDDLWFRNHECNAQNNSCISPSILKCNTHIGVVEGKPVILCVDADDL
jgi:hypothetical protein